MSRTSSPVSSIRLPAEIPISAAIHFSAAFGITFEELHTREGLRRVDDLFLSHLATADASLSARLISARAKPLEIQAAPLSELLIACAIHLEEFIASLFSINDELTELRKGHREFDPIFNVRRGFVERRAARELDPQIASALDGIGLLTSLGIALHPASPGFELAFAKAVQAWHTNPATNAPLIDAALQYAAWAVHSDVGRCLHRNGILFTLPERMDNSRLVPVHAIGKPARLALDDDKFGSVQRDGFELTDRGTDLAGALHQAHYCIHCHKQQKDSCSKGFQDRHTGAIRRNSLGNVLAGCPLEERISEFLSLKAEGRPIAALAMIMIDNPLVAATGHRICNDCMKACIYQKQEPVDIPQAETRTLKDVLELPWGFELYSLLSRWNPLNLERTLPLPQSGYKILVVGLGPSGFALAHHLLNDGHTVIAIDGLKIEPLPTSVSGVVRDGSRAPFLPINDIATLRATFDQRVAAGFGGVAEYGITARWDKNFLVLIRILLERRSEFAMFGGVRFGGTMSFDDAFKAGFDHVALCTGTGRPTLLRFGNSLARGVRQASDFLMALQLTGAGRSNGIANMQIRMPIVVIGGGLTALDAATEALAYYPVQIERFLRRYEVLCAANGEDSVRKSWSREEAHTADEFLDHGRAIRAERASAATENREPELRQILDRWGGSTVVYRRGLTDAPSYRLNHTEVEHAFREGVRFLEQAAPVSVAVDEFGHACALELTGPDGDSRIPAKTILVAVGAQPNTILAQEEPGYLKVDGRYFAFIDQEGRDVVPDGLLKPDEAQVLTHRTSDRRFISFFGDLHPTFNGNVVKALASAQRGSRTVSRSLRIRHPTEIVGSELITRMNHDLRATVRSVRKVASSIIEIIVHAPQATRKFRPGQFYRLQNFESLAGAVNGTTLAMEGIALTGAWVDVSNGLIALIVLETGGSADLCDLLHAGDPIVLMGPTGQATELPRDKTVCLVGGGLGNAVLFSIGQAARARGNRVVYFAAYRSPADRFEPQQIESAADVVVWSSDQSPGITPHRPQDKSMVGNVVQAMHAYACGALGPLNIRLSEVDHLIAIGSDRMMAAVAKARRDLLAPFLSPNHNAIGSINSPMQCMMKEICAQCLQLLRDPQTGIETTIFTCAGQDQKLDNVDFEVLRARLSQNSTSEKLVATWLRHCRATQSTNHPLTFPGIDS